MDFHQSPILNSPYELPTHYWELDESGQPTNVIREGRRRVRFETPIPAPRKSRAKSQHNASDDISQVLPVENLKRRTAALIYDLRTAVGKWRMLPEKDWKVTPATARLLKHWRHHKFTSIRPFFCQVEAAEIIIWLTEVAPNSGKAGRRFLNEIKEANEQAGHGLNRLALKLATGAGKTTVMAMLIAWQTINAARMPTSERFTRGFLIVTPGITIRDRLRVLLPRDPDSYYQKRELVPRDMLRDLDQAKIVITNYHAFKRRQTLDVSASGRSLLQGRGPEIDREESEGQMLARVCRGLLSMNHVLVFNDEAHHCYREKPGENQEKRLVGDNRKEAKQNKEAARVWISGLEALCRKGNLRRVIDLSATPFFLQGSGYEEGTIFPWTVSDYSLMDAIEAGIVKLPRVPTADNITSSEVPMFRELWNHIGNRLPSGTQAMSALDPLSLPTELQTALEVLYGHYDKTFQLWEEQGIPTPPCFIVVCNNTATSKLVYDYIAGFHRQNELGDSTFVRGHLELFRNFDANGQPFPRQRTLLIDSRQLESGDALNPKFREVAAEEIEHFRREIMARTGDRQKVDQIRDEDLLREVMNTVGQNGRLGGDVRCVVSVSMLSEGWDANNVTHVLGVRAFGTQLLCEQVIGRALRRQSYDLNENDLLNVEYADVFGIPFDFTAKPVRSTPIPPPKMFEVKTLAPERDRSAMRFPRVLGYRTQLADDHLDAEFSEDSRLELTPGLLGPTITHNEGIIGEGHDLTLEHLDNIRSQKLLYYLTERLLYRHWGKRSGQSELHLFGQLKRITGQWLRDCVTYRGKTREAQLMIPAIADLACGKIIAAITRSAASCNSVQVLLDPYCGEGSTYDVNFWTSKPRYRAGERCHLNYALLDSNWEGEFCRVLDSHPKVIRWVKNHNLGFEVPYTVGSSRHMYIPDFLVDLDYGLGDREPLHVVAEVKGFRGEDAKAKSDAMHTYWIPGVNNSSRGFGYWAFLELRDACEMHTELDRLARSKGNVPGREISKDEAIELLRDHKSTLLERHGVTNLALFGSMARGNASLGSDIDILVSIDSPSKFHAYFDALYYLEDLFGRRVDLVTWKAIRPEWRPSIEKEAIYV